MVVVREAKTKKEQRDFLNFRLSLYKGNPYFVPPLWSDEKRIFRSDYFYYDMSEAVYFNAYRDGKMVGRISGILQKASNEKWKQQRIRFTRFDCINDQEVASALFKAVEDWGRLKGMKEICGPLGFSDMEREGLLIDGFNELSTFEEDYNYDYYQKLIENLGYQKEVDWTERKLYAPKTIDPRIEEFSLKMMKRLHLHLANPKNINQLLKEYGRKFFDIVDITYRDIYMSVPFTEPEMDNMIKGFKLIVKKEKIKFILNEKNEVVAFGLCFPSIGKALQKSSGHLTLPCLIKLLRSINHPKIIDMGLIGVLPQYKNTGISWVMLSIAMNFLKSGVEYAETNLNLENNLAIQNTWNRFESVIHKRRRSYLKQL